MSKEKTAKEAAEEIWARWEAGDVDDKETMLGDIARALDIRDKLIEKLRARNKGRGEEIDARDEQIAELEKFNKLWCDRAHACQERITALREALERFTKCNPHNKDLAKDPTYEKRWREGAKVLAKAALTADDKATK